MTWSISTVVSPGGATATTYTLNLPGLGLEASATFNKINSAQTYVSGDIIDNVVRTSGGAESWGVNNGQRARPGGIVADAFSGGGTPTFTGRKIITRSIGTTNGALRTVDFVDSQRATFSSVFGYSELRSITKPPAESWAEYGRCFAYTDGSGIIQYTNSLVTANSIGGLRYIVGDILCADPADSLKWIVGIVWTTNGGLFSSCGESIAPTIPYSGTAFLTHPAYSNQELTLATSFGSPTAQRVFMGPIVSITGTGASTKVGFNLGNGSIPSDIYASTTIAPSCAIRQSVSADGIGNAGCYEWTWKTASIWTGTALEYDTLTVRIPALIIMDNQYTINFSPSAAEGSIDVSLPFPIGDCRIVWSFSDSAAGSTPSGCGFLVPYLVRRTSPSSSPYSGASRNASTRPISMPSVTHPTPYQFMPYGVYVSNLAAVPYGLLPLSDRSIHCHGREVFPSANHNADLWPEKDSASGGPTQVEASWGYWDCSLGTPGWTTIGSSTSLSIAHSYLAENHWSGAVAPPVMPSDYPQGGMTILYRTFTGSWSSWGPLTPCGIPSANIGLPVYPWDTGIPPWLDSDADVTPVANAGWIDSINRDVMPTISWSGAPGVSYSAGQLGLKQDDATPSSSASKMFGPASLTSGHARVTAFNGKLLHDGSRWRFLYDDILPMGPGGTNLYTVQNPSTLGPSVIQVDMIARAAPPTGGIAIFSSMMGSVAIPTIPPGQFFQAQVTIP